MVHPPFVLSRSHTVCYHPLSLNTHDERTAFVRSLSPSVLQWAVAGRMSETLLEAVRGLHVAYPDLGVKPLLAQLREQHPGLGAGNKEVREALKAVKAVGEAKAAAPATATTPAVAATSSLPTAESPSHAALSLACIGCARCPSDMDDGREKHPICDMCRDEKLPTTYLCGKDCPANPGAWDMHGLFHKKLRKHRRAGWWSDAAAAS